MIALRKLGPRSMGLAEVEPRPPAAGEVRLDVIAAGVCGTDLHIADDEFPSHPPVTMGHEVTGVVAEAGGGVDRSWIGRRVACETYFSVCGRCEHCRQGKENLCEQRQSIGTAVDGGFAPSLTLPARNLWQVSEQVGRRAGALMEPLACVAQCLLDPAVVAPGDRVLVTGPGTMGLLTAQVAAAAGGEVTVLGLERDKARLDVAHELGFATAVARAGGSAAAPGRGTDQPTADPRGDSHRDAAPASGGPSSGSAGGSGSAAADQPADRLAELAAGRFDVVCETSGSGAGAAACLHAAARGGAWVQVGIFGKPVELDLDQVLYKQLTMTSGNASTARSWARAVRLVAAGHVRLDPLVTDAIPLAQWERAFAQVRAGDGVKTVLVPE